jgi:hypothetical protein
MVKKINLFLLVLFTFSSIQLTHSQSTESENSLKSGTIDSQFEYIYQNSNNFQEYKVVKKTNLDQLKSNILDSMKMMRGEVIAIKGVLSNKNDSIANLNSSLEVTANDMQEAIDAKDNFDFLGIGIEKSVYSTMMWLIVIGLAAALGFFSFQYSRSFSKIRKAQKDLVEVQEELENHRKSTLERERKLKRELIDAQMRKNS